MSHKRYAYCIGGNGPRSSWYDPLKYAEKDAERLASAFTTSPCNFAETKWGVATDRTSTLAGLSQFVKQCQSPDLLIVHFSGHAILDEELYLLCNETDYDDLVSSAIEVGAVKKILSRSPARYNLLILDCCHAGGAHRGAFKGEHAVQDTLNRTFQGSANVILSACARYERTRELDTLDGGAGFLSWALAAACTTRFQEASQDGHSLSLANFLHWLPAVLEEIKRSLKENEQLSVPEALIYARGGDGEVWFTEPGGLISSRIERDARQDRQNRLKAMLPDHIGFMRDRLSSFVGRVQELAEIRQRISEKQQTGGYITITGQAGQGKSSIIAKLVEEYGPENVAFHFIPFNPGPDHQVTLLRNLMARLILKYELPDLYVASESRPALRDYFPKVLAELVAKGGREVIFIDGLDQLEEEQSGVRDLSFLPNNPPPNIVFVLGTRPNDALRPLELLKPRYEYKLPNLSRSDFDLILNHRKVQLNRELADRFYKAMQENALYLDLVAKELAETGTKNPIELIKRVTANPDNIFSLSVDRFKRRGRQWRTVLKPLLGLLLAASEPLAVRHIRQILTVEDDEVRDGLRMLGGLVAEDGQGRRYLFHLKLYDYLRQDDRDPEKEYVFASDEEQGWHHILTNWCEQGNLSLIWDDVKHDPTEQERREYARKHYVTHLYNAREWQTLFAILDAEAYGQAKMRYDPSTRSYAQDLDVGRRAAAWEGWTMEESIEFIPNLWRYTLLRCSLTSRADSYTPEAFDVLLLLGHELEALGLVELLTDPANKVSVLMQIAKQLAKKLGQEQESIQLLVRSHMVANSIVDSETRVEVLLELGRELAQAQQWEYAEAIWADVEAIADITEDDETRDEILRELGCTLARAQQLKRAEKVADTLEAWAREKVLCELGCALTEAQQWNRAEAVARSIKDNEAKGLVLLRLGSELARVQQWERAERMWQEAEAINYAVTYEWRETEVLCELGCTLAEAQQWNRAEAVARAIKDSRYKGRVLCELGCALADAQQWERAERMWHEVEELARSISDTEVRAKVLCELGGELARAQQWERAEQVWHEVEELARSISDTEVRAKVLCELGGELARAQQWERAEQVWYEVEALAKTFWNSEGRTELLHELCRELARARQWERAEAVARTIEDSETRTRVLSQLAQARQQERTSASATTLEDSKAKAGRSSKLDKKLGKMQDWERDEAVRQEVEAVLRTMNSTWLKVRRLSELGGELARVQQWDQAEVVWQKAEVLARSINDREIKAEMLLGLSGELARVQQWKRAERIWQEVEALVRSINSVKAKAKVLRELGGELARAQQWERAEAVADLIEESGTKAEVLRELGGELARAQQWERAEAIVYTIKDSEIRAEVLLELVDSARKHEQMLNIVQRAWLQADTRAYAIKLLPLAKGLIRLKPEISTAFCEAFTWVDTFLKG